MTLKVKVSGSHFQYQPRVSEDESLVHILRFQRKSVTSYCADKPNFLEFLVKMATMALKINDPSFQYQPRVSHDACLVQIGRFQLKSVTSNCVGNAKFTDRRINRQTDGQMQATTLPICWPLDRRAWCTHTGARAAEPGTVEDCESPICG